MRFAPNPFDFGATWQTASSQMREGFGVVLTEAQFNSYLRSLRGLDVRDLT